MKITIDVSSDDRTNRPNPIIVKRWLIDNIGSHLNGMRAMRVAAGPGWQVEWFAVSNQLFWTITIDDDDKATEFALRFL